MPLPPLPASNTKRYKLRYTVAGSARSMTARCSSAQTDGNAIAFFNAQFAALSAGLGNNVVWTQIDVALVGSDVFNPIVGWSPLTGTAGGPVDPVDTPRALCFPGRTVGGRKSKVYVFGVASSFPMPATYEIDPLSGGAFLAFRSNLNTQVDFWLGIDGLKPNWYFRATMKQNDHYVGLKR